MKNRKLAWFYGWLTADGHLKPIHRPGKDVRSISWCLHSKDSDVLDKFKCMFDTNTKVRQHNYNGKPTVHFNIFNKDVVQEAFEDDPKNKIITKDCPWDYVRGIFEGDGCFYIRPKNNNLVTIFYGSKIHLQWIGKLISNYFNVKYKEPRYSANTYEIRWEGRIARLIAWRMYKDTTEDMRLDRKYSIWNNYNISKVSLQGNNEELENLLSAIETLNVNMYEIDKGLIVRISGMNILNTCKSLSSIISNEMSIPTGIPFLGKGKKKNYSLYLKDIFHTINTPACNA